MKRVLLPILALSLLTGSAAMADPGHYGDHGRDGAHNDSRDVGHGYDRSHQYPAQRDARGWHSDNHWNSYGYRNGEHRDWRPTRYPAHGFGYRASYRPAEYYRPYGYYPHTWVRGEYLPVEWQRPAYTVYDYPAYSLQPPPAGYRWVRVNDDAVLAAITGGVVADAVYHLFR